MNRRQFVGSAVAGVVGGLAGCGGQGSTQKATPPNEGGRATWVASHDYSSVQAHDIPGIDTGRRGIDWGFRRLGTVAASTDRSTAYLGGEPADAESGVTAVDLSEGSRRWQAAVDDRSESSLSDVVRAGDGAIAGFDRGRSVSGGGIGGEVSGTVPEFVRLGDGGEPSDPTTAAGLAPEPDADFDATTQTVFVSNGRLDSVDPAVAGYDSTTGEQQFLEQQAQLAATTETTAFVVERTTAESRVVAYDTVADTVRWERTVGTVQSLTVGPDRVYIVESAETDRLHALDRSSGERRWTGQLDATPRIGPVVVDDTVLVAGQTLSVYDSDGTRRGSASEAVRSPNPYDRVRVSEDRAFLTTRPDLARVRTVAVDLATLDVVWTVERWLPLLGVARGDLYLPTDTRPIEGGDDRDRVDTRIERRSGADGRPLTDVWVHGRPVAVDGRRLYTLSEPTESTLGALYAYDLPVSR